MMLIMLSRESPSLFIIFTNWMDKLSRIDDCVIIGRCKTSPLLFADDLVLLASYESDLQHALHGFAAAYDIAGIKISTSKTEVLHLSRNPVECSLQVGGVLLKQVEKFKYLGVAFTKNGTQDEELSVQSGKASAAVQALHHFGVLKRDLLKKLKLLVFKAIFVPILTCSHKSWVMTERMRSHMQAFEMRLLLKIKGVKMYANFVILENLSTSSRNLFV